MLNLMAKRHFTYTSYVEDALHVEDGNKVGAQRGWVDLVFM